MKLTEGQRGDIYKIIYNLTSSLAFHDIENISRYTTSKIVNIVEQEQYLSKFVKANTNDYGIRSIENDEIASLKEE